MACGLGGKTVFPHILRLTPQMLQQADWKFRHAALMAISATGEGCHKQMESYLPEIMNGVINFINDPVSAQCGNLVIFLPLRFYVKSNFGDFVL